MLQLDGIEPPEFENTHSYRIKLLKKEGLISLNIDDILYSLRTTRNKAVHNNYDSFDDYEQIVSLPNSSKVVLNFWDEDLRKEYNRIQ
jgi:type I restriction enzyme R subunit